MPIFGSPLGGFWVASLEPGPHAFIVTVGQTLGKIVCLLIEARKEGAHRLLVSFTHRTTMARGQSTIKRSRDEQSLRDSKPLRSGCWLGNRCGKEMLSLEAELTPALAQCQHKEKKRKPMLQ
jgi:hypothetical protein